MKRMKRNIIPAILLMTMMLLAAGCKADEPILTDAEVSTEEQDTEETPEIHLTIGQESLNVAFTLDVGESRKLDVETDYDGELEYLSGDEAIVTVDQDGMVTAVSNGLVKMTVTAGDVERHVNVVVKEPASQVAEETDVAQNEASSTVRSNQAIETTESKGSSNGSTSNTTAASAPSETVGNTDSTEAPTSTFNPEDYYLDWYYIANQVNAKLQATYPDVVIGSGIEYDGAWYESSWQQTDGYDGYEGCRTAEEQINNFYSAISNRINSIGGPSDAIGMFINDITVNSDGQRDIWITWYY